MRDLDGYGFDSADPFARLTEDVRVLAPSGIERISDAFKQLAQGERAGAYAAATVRATEALENSGRIREYDKFVETLFGLTESATALVDWAAEHGDAGHRAEQALRGAALALAAGDLVDADTRRVLTAPAADALPWLAAR
jgi:hypothetical protein